MTAAPPVSLWQREKEAWVTCLHEAARAPREPRVGWSIALFGSAICAFLYWRNEICLQRMDFSEYNLLNTACILGLPLIFTLLFLRRDPAEVGMTVGDAPTGLRYALAAFLVFTPVLLISGASGDAQQYYLPWLSDYGGSGAFVHAAQVGFRFVPQHIDSARLAYHELVMCFYMFGWEYFFRGFLLTGLRRLLPLWVAIFLQTLFFATLHVGKPMPELLSSLPGGILLALLAIRCRSFVPCFLLHFLISSGYDYSVLFAHFHPYLPHAAAAVAGISPLQK